MSIEEIKRVLASLPEVVEPQTKQLQSSDLLSVAAEFSKVLRKVGIQQTRTGTDLLGQMTEATSRIDEVHQAALDARDRAVQAERQLEKMAGVVIGQIDLVERAVGVMEAAGGLEEWATSLRKGVDPTLAEAAKWGLTSIGLEGEPFDPRVHDSMNQVGRTDSPLTVKTTIRRGFLLNGQVVRRADVEIEEVEEGR